MGLYQGWPDWILGGGVFRKYPPPASKIFQNTPSLELVREDPPPPPPQENFGRKWRVLPEIRPFCSPFSVIFKFNNCLKILISNSLQIH